MTDNAQDYPELIRVQCNHCPDQHVATFSHLGQYGEGPIYGVWSGQCYIAWKRGDGSAYDAEFYTREAAVDATTKAVVTIQQVWRTDGTVETTEVDRWTSK